MKSANRSNLAVAALVLLCSAVLILLVHGIYSRFRDVVIEQTRGQLVIRATEAAHNLGRLMEERSDALRGAISNPLVLREISGGKGGDLAVSLLEDLISSHRCIVEIELFDEHLTPIRRVSAGAPASVDPGKVLIQAALAQGRPLIGEELIWRDSRPYVQMAVPAQGRTDTAARGVARMLVSLETVLTVDVLPHFDAARSTVWLVARDGTIVWHPLHEKIGKPMLTGREIMAPNADPSGLTAILEDMRAGNRGSGVYEFGLWRTDPTTITLKIAGYAPVRGFGGALSLGVSLEYGQIAAPIQRYAVRVGVLAVPILTLIGVGALLYLRKARHAQGVQGELLGQLNHVLSVSPAAVYHFKRNGSGKMAPTFLSASLQEKFGYGPEEMEAGVAWWHARIHPDDVPSTHEAWAKLQEGGQVEHSFRFRHKRGHYLWVRDVARLLRDGRGEIVELVGSWQDVTATRQTEESLRLAERLFENAVEGAFVADQHRRLLRVNDAFCRMTGYQAAELLGRECPAVRPGYQDFDFPSVVDPALESEGSWSGEVRVRRKDGAFFPGRLSLSTVMDSTGRISHHIGLVTDLSAQRELEQTVQRLSHYDPLTALPNRVLLMEHLAQEINEAAHRKEQLAVLFLDIDRFKQINETLGREVGDTILKQVATRLQYGLEASAILTQPGGDQFVVILPALKDPAHASYLAAEIGRLVGEPMRLGDLQLDVSPSIGISLYPQDGADATELVHNAEAAMYHVKSGGGGAYHFFTTDLNDRALRRLKLVQALREAVPRQELKLAFQPQMELGSGRVIGVEALLRWENPELGLVSPAEFVPLAEESGLIIAMGEWVLAEACRQAAGWQVYGPVRVGVNLSLRQFQTGTLAQTVDRVLADSGLDPALLELEITESLAMADPDGTTRTLDALRELGIRLALDDFGTGYSSLAYLQRLPLDTLKIDRAFIEHLETKQDDVVLTGTIISMAHALGLTVIAEGVETFRQLEILREHGCDEIQGYFLSRPLYASDFETWFQQHRERLARSPKGPRLDLV